LFALQNDSNLYFSAKQQKTNQTFIHNHHREARANNFPDNYRVGGGWAEAEGMKTEAKV
jgi:hypothetical protein